MTIEPTEKELQTERAQVEAVFSLGGGELNGKPLEYQEGPDDRSFRYHYDGAPEYADEFKEMVLDSEQWLVFTAVTESPAPESILVEGREYKLRAFFGSSGEAECPCRGCEDDPYEGVDCPLCERSADEDAGRVAPDHGHGHVYLGETWGEAVYVCDLNEHMRRVCKSHNCNVWEAPEVVCDCCGACAPSDADSIQHDEHCDDRSKTETRKAKWWWQTCAPGCLPDSDVFGPFDSENEALSDASDGLA